MCEKIHMKNMKQTLMLLKTYTKSLYWDEAMWAQKKAEVDNQLAELDPISVKGTSIPVPLKIGLNTLEKQQDLLRDVVIEVFKNGMGIGKTSDWVEKTAGATQDSIKDAKTFSLKWCAKKANKDYADTVKTGKTTASVTGEPFIKISKVRKWAKVNMSPKQRRRLNLWLKIKQHGMSYKMGRK